MKVLDVVAKNPKIWRGRFRKKARERKKRAKKKKLGSPRKKQGCEKVKLQGRRKTAIVQR